MVRSGPMPTTNGKVDRYSFNGHEGDKINRQPFLKGMPIMDTSTRLSLVSASVIAALLMLVFGGGMATGTMMNGDLMGKGNLGEIDSMWLPVFLFVAFGVVLFSVIFRNKWFE